MMGGRIATNELDLIIYIPSVSSALQDCLMKAPAVSGVHWRFVTEAKIPEPTPKATTVLIVDTADELVAACEKAAPDIAIVYCGDAKALEACGDSALERLEEIWPYSESPALLRVCFDSLVNKLKDRNDTWLYHNLLTSTIDSMPEMVWYKDLEGAHLMVNEQFCRTVHKTKEQIAGHDHYYIWDTPVEDYKRGKYICVESEDTVIEKRETCVFEEVVKTPDGMKQFRTYKTPIFDRDGSVMGTVGVAHDVTDFSNIDYELSILIENLPFPLLLCDKNWDVIRTNNNFKRAFRITEDQDSHPNYRAWKSASFCVKSSRLSAETKSRVEEVVLPDQGHERIFSLIEQEIVDSFGYISGYFCLFTDVTVERLYEDKIMQLANTDPLTQLYNRRYFYSYVKQHEANPITIFYLDLDHFKAINDTFGHKFGDNVLIATADHIKNIFPDGIAARLGGDEFVVALYGTHEKADMQRRADDLSKAIEQSFPEDAVLGHITISIGIAQAENDSTNIDALMAESDAQMYRQKGTHRRIAPVQNDTHHHSSC